MKLALSGAQFSGCAANSRGSLAISPRPRSSLKPMSQPMMLLPAPVGMMTLSGCVEVEVLPKLVGQRLRSLEEERLPVVAGVEDPGGHALRRVAGFLARSGNALDLGAIGARLHDLVLSCRGRNENLCSQPAGRRISGDRRPAVSGAVLKQPRHALGAQDRHHHGSAPVLEAAGWRKPFELEEGGRAAPAARDERRQALAHRDRIGNLNRQGGGVAPQRSHARIDHVARNSRQGGDHQRRARVGAPPRLGDRIFFAAYGIDIGRRVPTRLQVIRHGFAIMAPRSWGSQTDGPAPLAFALVQGTWTVALKVHPVVQDAHDFDRAQRRRAVHQDVTSATTVARDVQRTETGQNRRAFDPVMSGPSASSRMARTSVSR